MAAIEAGYMKRLCAKMLQSCAKSLSQKFRSSIIDSQGPLSETDKSRSALAAVPLNLPLKRPCWRARNRPSWVGSRYPASEVGADFENERTIVSCLCRVVRTLEIFPSCTFTRRHVRLGSD
jgi:hypothetical protein